MRIRILPSMDKDALPFVKHPTLDGWNARVVDLDTEEVSVRFLDKPRVDCIRRLATPVLENGEVVKYGIDVTCIFEGSDLIEHPDGTFQFEQSDLSQILDLDKLLDDMQKVEL